MAVTNWLKDPAWDVLFLNDKRLPGVATVSLVAECDQDVQKPDGATKAKTKDKGDKPIKFKIILQLSPADIQELPAFMPILRPRTKGGARDPVTITHPQAALWGVSSITTGDLDAPSPKAGANYILSFSATEWTPSPTKVKKPKEAPAGNGDANDPKKLAAKLKSETEAAAKKNF